MILCDEYKCVNPRREGLFGLKVKMSGASIFEADASGSDNLRYLGKSITDPINTAEVKKNI